MSLTLITEPVEAMTKFFAMFSSSKRLGICFEGPCRSSRDWFPTGNAELLVRGISQLLQRPRLANCLLAETNCHYRGHRMISLSVTLKRNRTAAGKDKVSLSPLRKMREMLILINLLFLSFRSVPTAIFVIFMFRIHSRHSKCSFDGPSLAMSQFSNLNEILRKFKPVASCDRKLPDSQILIC